MATTNQQLQNAINNIPGLSKNDKTLFYDALTGMTANGNININIQGGNQNNTNSGNNKRGGNKKKRKGGNQNANFFEKSGAFEGVIETVGREFIKLAKKTTEAWRIMDTAASKYARSVGMTEASRRAVRRLQLERNRTLGLSMKYNISDKEFTELQNKIQNQTGRRVGISNEASEYVAALNNVIGPETASQYISKLDEFGIGMVDAGKLVGEVFREASEQGVNFEEYSKNFLENIEMAQTLNFKKGVEGVKSMAKKAAELKFSMKAASSFAEKVGDLQGAIEAGARLQSLGGTFATLSNPLDMMAESFTDTEALYDRMTKMFSIGKFNRETGQVDFTNIDRRRMKAASEAIGVSYDEMIKGGTNAERRREMEKALSSSGINVDESIKKLLLNIGTFQNGKAGYVDRKGDFKNLSEISLDNIEELRALNNTDSQNFKDMVISLKSIDETISGIKEQYNSAKAFLIEKLNISKSIDKIKAVITEFGVPIAKALLTIAGISAGWKIAKGSINIAGSFSKFLSFFKKGFYPPYAGRNASGGGNQNTNSGQGFMHKALDFADKTDNMSKVKPIKKMLKKVPSVFKLAGVAGMVADAGVSIYDGIQAKKAYSSGDRQGGNKKTGQSAGAIIGGALGAVFAGPIGASIGSTLGRAMGGPVGEAITRAQDRNRRQTRERLGISSDFHGDYTTRQLKQISSFMANDGHISEDEVAKMSKRLRNKFIESGDSDLFLDNVGMIGTSNFSSGGIVPGHKTYGDQIIAGLNSKEMVLTQNQQARLFRILSSSNEPIFKPNLSAVEKPMVVSPSTRLSDGIKPGKVEIDPINININGSIKLTGKGGEADITNELLKDPKFIREITSAIVKQINVNENVRYKA